MEDEPKGASQELQNVSIETLPIELGFAETPELEPIHLRVVEAMQARNYKLISEELSLYQIAAKRLVEQYKGTDNFAKAQIGLIVAVALMWKEAGKLDSYGAELWNARNYAANMKFADVHAIIDTAYKEVEEIEQASDQADYVGPSTEEMITRCKKEFPSDLREELNSLSDLPADKVMEEIAAMMINHDFSEKPEMFFERMGWSGSSVSESHPMPDS